MNNTPATISASGAQEDVEREDILQVVKDTRSKLGEAKLAANEAFGYGLDSVQMLPITHFGIRITLALTKQNPEVVASTIANILSDLRDHRLTKDFFN